MPALSLVPTQMMRALAATHESGFVLEALSGPGASRAPRREPMIRHTAATLVLAAAAAVAAAPPAAANHSLGHKVQALTAKLNCLQKYPVFAFADYAYYDFADPSVQVLDTGLPPAPVQVLRDNQEITALDFNYGPTMGQSDAFLLGVKDTSSCRSKFPTAPNPVALARVASTAKMLRLQ
jgi:hypothetical protein